MECWLQRRRDDDVVVVVNAAADGGEMTAAAAKMIDTVSKPLLDSSNLVVMMINVKT